MRLISTVLPTALAVAVLFCIVSLRECAASVDLHVAPHNGLNQFEVAATLVHVGIGRPDLRFPSKVPL
jgi:hypothetical protein